MKNMKKFIVTAMSILMLFNMFIVPAFAAEQVWEDRVAFMQDAGNAFMRVMFNYRYDEELDKQDQEGFCSLPLREYFNSLKKIEKGQVCNSLEFACLYIRCLYENNIKARLVLFFNDVNDGLLGRKIHPCVVLDAEPDNVLFDVCNFRAKAADMFVPPVFKLKEYVENTDYKYVMIIKNFIGDIDKKYSDLENGKDLLIYDLS